MQFDMYVMNLELKDENGVSIVNIYAEHSDQRKIDRKNQIKVCFSVTVL